MQRALYQTVSIVLRYTLRAARYFNWVESAILCRIVGPMHHEHLCRWEAGYVLQVRERRVLETTCTRHAVASGSALQYRWNGSLTSCRLRNLEADGKVDYDSLYIMFEVCVPQTPNPCYLGARESSRSPRSDPPGLALSLHSLASIVDLDVEEASALEIYRLLPQLCIRCRQRLHLSRRHFVVSKGSSTHRTELEQQLIVVWHFHQPLTM